MPEDLDEFRPIGDAAAIAKVSATIRKIINSIEPIVTDAESDYHEFKYASWQAVQPHVRASCIEHGLTIIPSIEHVEYITLSKGDKDLVRVLIRMSFTIVDDGSTTSITVPWWGESEASDDKGLQAAASIATKYFLLKLFQIATPEDVDTDSKAGGPKQRSGSRANRDQAIAAKKAVAGKKPSKGAAPAKRPRKQAAPAKTDPAKRPAKKQPPKEPQEAKPATGELPPSPLEGMHEEPSNESTEWPREILGYKLDGVEVKDPHFQAFGDPPTQRQVTAFRNSCKKQFAERELAAVSLIDGYYRNYYASYVSLTDVPKGAFTVAIDFVNNAAEETLKEFSKLVDQHILSDPFANE